jgi:protein TonB
VLCVVLGLHVAALTLLASRTQPVVQAPPLAMLQVALIEDQPAARAAVVPEPRPVQPLPRPAPLTRKAVPTPVRQAAVPAPAVEPAATSAKTGAAASAASDTSAPSSAATTNSQPVTAAATAEKASSQVSAARFDAEYLNNPAPAYPALSRRLAEEGEVRLKVLVSAAGLPARIELARSSGSDRLDRAARDAVARWRFIAARQGELNIEAWVLVPVIFRLQEN